MIAHTLSLRNPVTGAKIIRAVKALAETNTRGVKEAYRTEFHFVPEKDGYQVGQTAGVDYLNLRVSPVRDDEDHIRTSDVYDRLVVRNYAWTAREKCSRNSSAAGKTIFEFSGGLYERLYDYGVTDGRYMWPQPVDICLFCGLIAPDGRCPTDGNVPTVPLQVTSAFPAYRP